MNVVEFVKKFGLDHAKVVLSTMPKFIRESISQAEVMYNPRTKKYIERGPCSVLIQLDDEDDYYHSTMPYESSFYKECVLLGELKRLVESHEIVDSWRGLEKAMDAVINIEANGVDMNRVAQAIADVEQCQ